MLAPALVDAADGAGVQPRPNMSPLGVQAWFQAWLVALAKTRCRCPRRSRARNLTPAQQSVCFLWLSLRSLALAIDGCLWVARLPAFWALVSTGAPGEQALVRGLSLAWAISRELGLSAGQEAAVGLSLSGRAPVSDSPLEGSESA